MPEKHASTVVGRYVLHVVLPRTGTDLARVVRILPLRRILIGRPLSTASAPCAVGPARVSPVVAGPPVQGVWTVLRRPEGLASAHFTDNEVSIALDCLTTDSARLEVTFKALDPLAPQPRVDCAAADRSTFTYIP